MTDNAHEEVRNDIKEDTAKVAGAAQDLADDKQGEANIAKSDAEIAKDDASQAEKDADKN